MACRVCRGSRAGSGGMPEPGLGGRGRCGVECSTGTPLARESICGELGGVEKMSSAASGTAAGLARSGVLCCPLLPTLPLCSRRDMVAAELRMDMGSERKTPRESVSCGVMLLATCTVRLLDADAGVMGSSSSSATVSSPPWPPSSVCSA